MLKVEKWHDYEIRFVFKDGEWWAVATDVCAALGIKNVSKAVQGQIKLDSAGNKYQSGGLDEDQKGITIAHTLGGPQELLIINELGIYELVFRSRKEEAKQFRRWVYEMLKTLREKSGLEGFQVFRMMDIDHQKQMMSLLSDLPEATKKDYIKANTIANKVVSELYGFEKMVKKKEMTPEMLRDRQPILEDTAKLMKMKGEYGLDISVSQAVKNKWLNEKLHQKLM